MSQSCSLPSLYQTMHAPGCDAAGAGSVVWKCVLRFGGTLVAGILGVGALYFTVLCNGLSFENKPPKVCRLPA